MRRSPLTRLLAPLILSPCLAEGDVQNINGELTTSDFRAADSTLQTFFYDLHELSNPTASDVTVTLTLDAGPLLRPWASYWSTSPLPAANWESPDDIYSESEQTWSSETPGDILTFESFTLPAGATYQLAIATWDYHEAGAQRDTYVLSVDGTGVEVAALPEPSSVPLEATRVIALEGDGPPEGNGTFLSFNAPVLNDAGQVAFRGRLTGTPGGFNDDQGIYRGTTSATLAKIVRTGDLFNGAEAVGDLSPGLSINHAGQLAIYGEISGADDVLLRSSPDGLGFTEMARWGEATPSDDGEFEFFDTVMINNPGNVAFYASLVNTANPNEYEAIYRSDGVTTTKIMRSADEATVAGETLIIESLSFNDAGQVSFYADTFDGDVVLYRGDGTTLTKLYQNGDPVPGAGGGTFDYPSFPTMNESGDVAFGASIDGVADPADVGIYRTVNGSLEEIMRGGDAIPVGPGIFVGFGDEPIINDSGDVAFRGSLRHTPGGIYDDGGIFVSDGTAIAQLAREGSAAPGDIAQFSFFDDLSFNNHGQVVFEATLRLSAGSSSIGEGLYLYDPTEGLMKIAREGDSILGSTITFLSYASFQLATLNIEGTGFNNSGQVAYEFQLADGREGIALWSGPDRSAGAEAPAITSWLRVGGDTWELTLKGEAGAGFEFRSSTTLEFAPGALVGSLAQEDETNDPGTVTGGNLLTLDGNGDGKVRMVLTGPRNFVRAQTPAGP